jgi:hypothetical protein
MTYFTRQTNYRPQINITEYWRKDTIQEIKTLKNVDLIINSERSFFEKILRKMNNPIKKRINHCQTLLENL